MDLQSPQRPPPMAKILMLGDSRVGKSSIVIRFVEDYFTLNTISTLGKDQMDFVKLLGFDYKKKVMKIDNEPIALQIWDTAGQERFRSITQTYYRGAHGMFLVFDLTDKSSFDNIKTWLSQIKNASEEGVPIILLGNKKDLVKERVISQQDIEKLKIYTIIQE